MLNLFRFICVASCAVLLPINMVFAQKFLIYSSKQAKEVNLDQIVADAASYDVVIFGEEHNDSVAHHLQISLFSKLFAKYSNLALSLEMFDRDVQLTMDEYLKGFIRERNFITEARAWKNYQDYRPMVEFAKENKLDVICANAPKRYTNLAGRLGQKALADLPKASKKYFAPLPYDTASGAYYKKLKALTEHGPPTSPDSSKTVMPVMATGSFNMILSQSLWDATMAYSIFEYLKKNKGKKIMHVNGRFHSDEGFAVVTQLKKYQPKLKILVISAAPDDSFPVIDWEKHKNLGDYIMITDPKVPKTFKSN
jgi:uncharacterized iron-regulated protein